MDSYGLNSHIMATSSPRLYCTVLYCTVQYCITCILHRNLRVHAGACVSVGLYWEVLQILQ
jgi:hypothetical protein